MNITLQNEFTELMSDLENTFEKIGGYTSHVSQGMSGFPVELQMINRRLYETRAHELNELTKKTSKKYREFVNKWSSFFLIPH